jgi:hypothetical protein
MIIQAFGETETSQFGECVQGINCDIWCEHYWANER